LQRCGDFERRCASTWHPPLSFVAKKYEDENK
jgi:hypothetical protein